jgi:hypothetical protein
LPMSCHASVNFCDMFWISMNELDIYIYDILYSKIHIHIHTYIIT